MSKKDKLKMVLIIAATYVAGLLIVAGVYYLRSR